MGVREKLEEKIRRKKKEIQEFEMNVREGKAYIQALQESIRLIPKESGSIVSSEKTLRPGSAISDTYELLKKVGKPMHITEILKGIGKEVTKKERVSLSGTISWYVRKNEVFIRTAPNTFGLVGMLNASQEPPEDFGFSLDEEGDDVSIEEF